MKADLTACFMSTPMPNPFILASAPPTRNMEMVSRAFHEGWGGAVIKTMSQYTGDGDQALKDVSPRIFPLRVGSKFNGFNCGFMNIELGSQETHEQYCENIVKLKKEWPDRAVIASILYGSTPIKEKWCDAARDCERAGADALELNFSCPHGCSEIGSGASIGENPQKIMEILGWMKEATKLPLMVKLTAMSDIVYSSVICEENGANAICAINTVSAVPGIDISTFKPIFNVNGVGTSSGISGRVIRPIALRSVMEIARRVNIPISGCGGIYDWKDTAEFILAGASTVQICSAVMENGYGIIKNLTSGLQNYMENMGFANIDSFRGRVLNNIIPHAEIDRKTRVHPTWSKTHCVYCAKCVATCRDAGYQAISVDQGEIRIDLAKCSGCGLCMGLCPNDCLK